MKINAINNQNFEARKFRLPIKFLDFSNPDLMQYAKATKEVNMAKVYSNPNAKDLYEKAMKTQDAEEKARLLLEMGDYEIVNYGTGIIGFFRKLFNIKGPVG